MDFASLMSREISKTSMPSKPSSTSSTTTTTANKQSSSSNRYQKRSEVEAAREAAYLAEQAAAEQARQAKQAAKRQREEEESTKNAEREAKRQRFAEDLRQRRQEAEKEEERRRRKRLGLPELVDGVAVGDKEDGKGGSGETDKNGNDEATIAEDELRDKLRAMGEPAVLFGESHKARVKRLQRLGVVMTQGPIPTSLELVAEKEMKVECVPADEAGKRYLYRQLASYFTMLLQEWAEALAREEKRETFASKAALGAMVQAKENMTPLFRRFEKADLDASLLTPIVEIVRAAQEKRYVDANDGYLRLSIGKAAWPIGVTMVGIHERSAREKLHENEKGHVMGDEVTRKFLQAIKRCLSFAQVRWPPDDVRQLMG